MDENEEDYRGQGDMTSEQMDVPEPQEGEEPREQEEDEPEKDELDESVSLSTGLEMSRSSWVAW